MKTLIELLKDKVFQRDLAIVIGFYALVTLSFITIPLLGWAMRMSWS